MESLNQDKVGSYYTDNSELYGHVAYITVAKVNFVLPASLSLEDMYQHPRKAFGSCTVWWNSDCFKNPDVPTSQFAYFVDLPLDISNLKWWSNNPECNYRKLVQRKPRKGVPPSSVPYAQYRKWHQRNIDFFLDYLDPTQILELSAKLSDMSPEQLREISRNPK